MVRFTRLRRGIAWLALVAMLLPGIAPTVSRMLAADAMAGMAMAEDCTHHAASRQPAAPHAPDAPMDCCGYCCLLHHAPMVLAGAILAPVLPPLPTDRVAARKPARGPSIPLLSAEPRGPPTSRV